MCLKAWNWEVTPCIIHHFSWFFELVTKVLVLCMICMIFHDHFSWFCMILQFFGGIPIHITHNFPWFFEPVTIVLVLCMVCMILHDHISWFCIFGRFTPTYHTSFFLVFCHNGDSLVHDLHDHFSWFCMTIFHDFAWLFNCWDVHPHVLYTAPVLLLCNWISGGQECLDDHPWHLFQYYLLFWASFVKQVP